MFKDIKGAAGIGFVHRVGMRISRMIMALAGVDAVLLYLFHGQSLLEAFRESKAAIQLAIAQLVIMIAGFMFMMQLKRYGFGLLLVAVYILARDAFTQSILNQRL